MSRLPLAPLLLCAGLAGCSSSSDLGFSLFADPGQYQYHNCQQLAAAAKDLQARHTELQQLIEKADQGIAGPLVSAAAYRAEYRSTAEQLVVVEREQRGKKCLTPATWRSNAVIR